MVGDLSELGAEEAAMEVIDGDEGEFARRVQKVDAEEPAMLLKGPQDVKALVGDRVLLKAMFMGRPNPTVRWTRAVSLHFYSI